MSLTPVRQYRALIEWGQHMGDEIFLHFDHILHLLWLFIIDTFLWGLEAFPKAQE